MRKLKKVYIAGPDIFRENAHEIGEKYKDICRRYDFEGIFPLDNDGRTASEIFQWDINAIENCDIVVANLNPFRGKTIDDGTAFEIGLAYSRRKKIYGYMSDMGSLEDRYGKNDANSCNYEGFGLPTNLMIAKAVLIIEGDFETCIRVLSGKKYTPK